MGVAWSYIRTVGMVVVLTALLWLWAEAESLQTQTLAPRVEIVPGPDLATRVLNLGWAGSARMRVRGSTAAMDRLQRWLAEPVSLVLGVGGVPAVPGEHTLDLRASLHGHPDLAKLGVSIEEVDPPTLRLLIEKLTTRVLPVRFDGKGLDLEGDVQVVPPTATVRLTESQAERLPAEAVVTAVIDNQAMAGAKPETPLSVRGRLLPPPMGSVGGPDLTVIPGIAQVTFRLHGTSVTANFSAVPVLAVLPPEEVGKWDIELLDAVIPSVQVTGRREFIHPFDDPDRGSRLAAYVSLTRDELVARVSEKAASFTLAPTDLRFVPERPVVRLKITARPAGGS